MQFPVPASPPQRVCFMAHLRHPWASTRDLCFPKWALRIVHLTGQNISKIKKKERKFDITFSRIAAQSSSNCQPNLQSSHWQWVRCPLPLMNLEGLQRKGKQSLQRGCMWGCRSNPWISETMDTNSHIWEPPVCHIYNKVLCPENYCCSHIPIYAD